MKTAVYIGVTWIFLTFAFLGSRAYVKHIIYLKVEIFNETKEVFDTTFELLKVKVANYDIVNYKLKDLWDEKEEMIKLQTSMINQQASIEKWANVFYFLCDYGLYILIFIGLSIGAAIYFQRGHGI